MRDPAVAELFVTECSKALGVQAVELFPKLETCSMEALGNAMSPAAFGMTAGHVCTARPELWDCACLRLITQPPSTRFSAIAFSCFRSDSRLPGGSKSPWECGGGCVHCVLSCVR